MTQETLIKTILTSSKVIAVVGLSPKAHRTSHTVSEYLQEHGYRIIPVYPREDTILGEKVFRKTSDITEKVDTVLIFRKSEEVLPVVEDAVKIGPKYIWMQQGIENEEAAGLAKDCGIEVIMDRCMYKEHVKL